MASKGEMYGSSIFEEQVVGSFLVAKLSFIAYVVFPRGAYGDGSGGVGLVRREVKMLNLLFTDLT